jgi:hypothetical protein
MPLWRIHLGQKLGHFHGGGSANYGGGRALDFANRIR